MHHLDHAGYNIGATITSILPMAQKVYTGDDDGRVVSLLLLIEFPTRADRLPVRMGLHSTAMTCESDRHATAMFHIFPQGSKESDVGPQGGDFGGQHIKDCTVRHQRKSPVDVSNNKLRRFA